MFLILISTKEGDMLQPAFKGGFSTHLILLHKMLQLATKTHCSHSKKKTVNMTYDYIYICGDL